jgi:arylsulfatase A-like enzyme
MHIVDMYPTLLAAAGLPTDTLPAMDGLNQWEAILGRGTGDRNEVLLNHTPFHGALRIGDWKLVHNGRVNANAVTAGLAETFELFNLNADPGEQTDLSAAEPEKLAELRTRLEEYGRQAMQANIVGNRPPDGFRSPRVWGSFE